MTYLFGHPACQDPKVIIGWWPNSEGEKRPKDRLHPGGDSGILAIPAKTTNLGICFDSLSRFGLKFKVLVLDLVFGEFVYF